MSEIGSDRPFSPNTPPLHSQEGMKLPTNQHQKAAAPQGKNSLEKDSIENGPTTRLHSEEKVVQQEVINEVSSLSSEEIVEEELRETETPTNEEDAHQAFGGGTQSAVERSATGSRRLPVNIGKMTTNENGQQTDVPDDCIGHLANTLLEGTPESLCEAAEVFSGIISEDEDDEESSEGDEDDEDDEEGIAK